MTDARKLFITRGIRGLVDGLVSVELVTYLTALGFSSDPPPSRSVWVPSATGSRAGASSSAQRH